MQIAAVAFPEVSNRLIKRPSVVSIKRRTRKAPSPSNHSWARYEPQSKWTVVAAVFFAIAIHIGAVAIVEPGWNEHLARFWDHLTPAVEEGPRDERAN